MGTSPKTAATELSFLSLTEAAERIRTRAVSPVEITHACLQRIEQLDPRLRAFITVTAESALEEARRAEAAIGRGEWKGPLHGIPVALKDLIDTAGVRTTAASQQFAGRVPGQDAEVVRRLKAAGAVLVGKTNLHECAYGGSSMISHYGTIRNPYAPEHFAGGSSGGSAAALAAGMCYGALGTDTAGSIRLPAALCGVAGLKPTYGLVSARGVLPLSWSLDHVGPMARTVADLAVMLAVLAGYDPQDPTSVQVPVGDYVAEMRHSVSAMRVGVARESFFAELDPEVEKRVEEAIRVLEQLCGEAREVRIPVDADRTVASLEAWAFHEPYVAQHPERYHPETLKRIRAGSEIGATAYSGKKLELEQMRHAIRAEFPPVDVVVTPTVPRPAPSFAEAEAASGELRRLELVLLRNTRPFNVLGLPALSLPCGFTQAGLPVGLQISGPPGGEGEVLRVALAYEQATEWHKQRPGNL